MKRMRRNAVVGLVLSLAVAVSGAPMAAAAVARGATITSVPTPTTGRPTIALPPTIGRFDYQLGGGYRPPAGVRIVARDATDVPAPGLYSICYVNGFQTQPDQASLWSGRNGDLLLHTAAGRLVSDPDWPGEHILNPSTPQQRTRIMAIVGRQITDCARKGFRAVELDNLDTFTRFTRPATGLVQQSRALALARDYVALAHRLGLAVAQKNSAEITVIGKRSVGFDFAVAEECFAFAECASYTRVYGAHVLEIEYPDTVGRSFASVCASTARARQTILRDRDLLVSGHRGYLYRSC